ncbi:hypothetical protein QEG73_16325 [Chitinophagaceae bacterium 26-R-25]|nr:hypothetical protein [Chitinophagaceae bacterium 26-R-25]
MNKLLLKLVYLFRALMPTEVDFDKMMIIVNAKLTMDTRRVYLNYKNAKQKENRNHLNTVLLIYGFFGLMIGFLVFALPSFLLCMIIFHAYLLFMMAMTLVTDFSTVLLDTADNQIILSRPVSSKTIFMARLVHIMIYLLQFTIALSLFPIVFTFFKHGPLTGIGFCITTFLTVLLAVFTTYLFYLIMLRFSNEQKIKEIVTYFQIFMTIFFAMAYQIVPRIISLKSLAGSFELHWYAYFLPPVWMALLLDGLHSLSFDRLHIGMAALAIGMPVITFWLLNKYLAPYFSKKLSVLNNDAVEVSKGTDSFQKRSIAQKLSPFVCKKGFERSAFEMTWKITGRDKQFRLQFYPSLAYILIFVFVFVFRSNQSIGESWENLASTSNFLVLIYVPLFTISTGILIMAFNENFQASWIFYSTPVDKPGELLTGSLKALLVKYFLPAYLIMFVLALYVWHWAIVDDFFFGLCNNVLCFFIMSALTPHYLPFSRQPSTQQQTGKVVVVLVQMIMIGVLIGIHYILLKFTIVFYALIPFLVLGFIAILRNLQRLPWRKIAV